MFYILMGRYKKVTIKGVKVRLQKEYADEIIEKLDSIEMFFTLTNTRSYSRIDIVWDKFMYFFEIKRNLFINYSFYNENDYKSLIMELTFDHFTKVIKHIYYVEYDTQPVQVFRQIDVKNEFKNCNGQEQLDLLNSILK